MTTLNDLTRYEGKGCTFMLHKSEYTDRWSVTINRKGDSAQVSIFGSGTSPQEAYDDARAQLDRIATGAPELAPPALTHQAAFGAQTTEEAMHGFEPEAAPEADPELDYADVTDVDDPMAYNADENNL